MGLDLSRTTMANWIIYSSEHWLKPLTDRMHEILLESKHAHADETPVQVLNEPLVKRQQRNPICGYIQASKRVHIQSDCLYMHQTDADIIHRYSSTVFTELLYQMHIPDITISKAVSMHTAGHMQEESSETVFQMISKMQKIRFRLLR